jgi:hypothetical protein
LAIPDIIKGVECKSIADYATYHDAFNVAYLTEASSVVTIFVYMCVLASALTTSAGKNKFQLKL